jgi:MFS family permease
MLTDWIRHMPPLQPPSATRRLDVEEVLGAAGFTPFHRKAVAVTGMAWTFVAMEILLVGFTLPLFGSIWNLSATWLGWIGASALAGSLVGSLLLGRVADQIGRKPIFQACILWYSVFTALTALAWGPASLFGLRFLAGIGLGGMLVVDRRCSPSTCRRSGAGASWCCSTSSGRSAC